MKKQKWAIVIAFFLLVCIFSISCAASDNTFASSTSNPVSDIGETLGLTGRTKNKCFFSVPAIQYGLRDGELIVDTETRVVYLFYRPLGLQGASGLTPLIDGNGKPVLYVDDN